MIYTITFTPALDYVIHTNKLVMGGTNRAASELIHFGGKGINVATMLHNLGRESVALGFVAGFTGRAIEDGLARQGLRTDFIHLDQGLTRINVKIKGDQETEINGQGPAISPTALSKLFAQLDNFRPEDVLVLAGSIPKSMPKAIYAEILQKLEPQGVKVVVDAIGELLVKTLPHRPFLIKPNLEELENVVDRKLDDIQSIEVAARSLQEQGARNVLVSLGAGGTLLIDEFAHVHRVHAPVGQVVDSVGAGDSTIAGFLDGYLDTHNYAYAVLEGTAAGSATAFSEGIALATTVSELIDQMNRAKGGPIRRSDSLG
ncbi:MAG: 1-phosphofructokinase [Bifidobacteriaceae bacterium]|jgi:1-phosphofructokinase|nr:1-phosphofructokinase [Bifidobacteriaceae bacterium]